MISRQLYVTSICGADKIQLFDSGIGYCWTSKYSDTDLLEQLEFFGVIWVQYISESKGRAFVPGSLQPFNKAHFNIYN